VSFTFRAVATAINSDTCNKPSGTVANDLMIAGVCVVDDSTLTAPSGWTELYSYDDISFPNYAVTLKFFSKIAGSSEGSYYTWSGYGGNYIDIAIASFSGPTSPSWDEGNLAETVVSGNTLQNGTVTTDESDELIVYFGAIDITQTSATWTCTGATERADFDNGMFMASEVQATAGLSTARTFTASSSGAYDRLSITGCWKETVASAAITGTATASITEADVVAGGKTIIITLTNDTWIPAT
jgi:hypothetical protein